jgi:hypothetical protein
MPVLPLSVKMFVVTITPEKVSALQHYFNNLENRPGMQRSCWDQLNEKKFEPEDRTYSSAYRPWCLIYKAHLHFWLKF